MQETTTPTHLESTEFKAIFSFNKSPEIAKSFMEQESLEGMLDDIVDEPEDQTQVFKVGLPVSILLSMYLCIFNILFRVSYFNFKY